MSVPFIEFDGEGPFLHFAHANGFHPKSYNKLLSFLSPSFKIEASLSQPYWKDSKPEELTNWKQMAEHLVQYSNERGIENIVGIGHSMGAIISLMAQQRKKNLFSKLVLIEPVVMPNKLYWMQWLPFFIKEKVNPVAKIALKRKDHWTSVEYAYQHLRSKKVFSRISDDVFADFIKYAMAPSPNGGVTLSYSKEWESRIYCTAPNPWSAIKELNIPTLVIRGDQTNVISRSTWELWQDISPDFNFINVDLSGHLLPFERAEALSKIILQFLES